MGITAATVIILTRKGVTGLMLKVRKFKLINGKVTGLRVHTDLSDLEQRKASCLPQSNLTSYQAYLCHYSIHLNYPMLLEHASTLPQGLCTYCSVYLECSLHIVY